MVNYERGIEVVVGTYIIKDDNVLLWENIDANDVTRVFVWNEWWDFKPNKDGWFY